MGDHRTFSGAGQSLHLLPSFFQPVFTLLLAILDNGLLFKDVKRTNSSQWYSLDSYGTSPAISVTC